MLELIAMGTSTKNEDYPLNEEGISMCINVQDTPYLGNCRALFYKNNNPRLTIGPSCTFSYNHVGPLCLLATVVLTCFTIYYIKMMYQMEFMKLTFIASLLLFIQLSANSLVALSNPGIPNRSSDYPFEVLKSVMSSLSYCRVCKVIKDPMKRIIHCATCDLCVEGYDHHCPWISKCVGKGNLKYFYAYIGSTFIMLIFLLLSGFIMKANDL